VPPLLLFIQLWFNPLNSSASPASKVTCSSVTPATSMLFVCICYNKNTPARWDIIKEKSPELAKPSKKWYNEKISR